MNKNDPLLGAVKRVLNEKTQTEETGDKEEYQKFFTKALSKFGVDSPDELEGDKKKDFFDYVDKNWKGDDEKTESKEDIVTEDLSKLSSGARSTENAIYLLQKSLSPGSNLNKGIDRALGGSYKKEFQEMEKYVDGIIDIWETIAMDYSMQTEAKVELLQKFIDKDEVEVALAVAELSAKEVAAVMKTKFDRDGQITWSKLEPALTKSIKDKKKIDLIKKVLSEDTLTQTLKDVKPLVEGGLSRKEALRIVLNK